MPKVLKTRTGRILHLPTPEEGAEITAAALADADNPPLTEADFVSVNRGPGRPRGSTKRMVTLRIDADVLATYRAGGAGWQTRINVVLREALQPGTRHVLHGAFEAGRGYYQQPEAAAPEDPSATSDPAFVGYSLLPRGGGQAGKPAARAGFLRRTHTKKRAPRKSKDV